MNMIIRTFAIAIIYAFTGYNRTIDFLAARERNIFVAAMGYRFICYNPIGS